MKVKVWRKIYYANTNQKTLGVPILILVRAIFSVRKIIWIQEGYYIIIEGSILQDDIQSLIYKILTTEHQNTWGKKLIKLHRETDKFIKDLVKFWWGCIPINTWWVEDIISWKCI